MKVLAGLGILGVLLALVVGVASFVVYVIGVIFGFSQSFLLGLVSLIPVVGFIEGLLHLLGVI